MINSILQKIIFLQGVSNKYIPGQTQVGENVVTAAIIVIILIVIGGGLWFLLTRNKKI